MPERPLAEQFDDLAQREHALRLAMWVFLASELLLFAGLFALYSGYRVMYPAEFAESAARNAVYIGTANTLVLITSSLTVALTVHAARTSRFRLLSALLAVTIVLGLLFLVLKGVEYARHYREGLLPGVYYRASAQPSYGARRFWTLYWVTTGLHALHVTAGLAVLTWMLARSLARAYTPAEHVFLELGTLYWHLVDIIWIFLWPLLYLTH